MLFSDEEIENDQSKNFKDIGLSGRTKSFFESVTKKSVDSDVSKNR